MRLLFTTEGWRQYLEWQDFDRKQFRWLNMLIEECTRTPFVGRGKPEPLRHELSGWWSRRIDDEHRLVYRIDGDDLVIAYCRYHCRR